MQKIAQQSSFEPNFLVEIHLGRIINEKIPISNNYMRVNAQTLNPIQLKIMRGNLICGTNN